MVYKGLTIYYMNNETIKNDDREIMYLERRREMNNVQMSSTSSLAAVDGSTFGRLSAHAIFLVRTLLS